MSSLRPCKGCQHSVSPDAKACPNCGKPNPTGSLADQNISCGCLLLVLILFILAGTVSQSTQTPETPDKPYETYQERQDNKERQEKVENESICELQIQDSLHYPSSFKTPWNGAQSYQKKGQEVNYVFDFEAMNGFGNMIPQRGYCTIKNGKIYTNVSSR